MDKNAAVLVTGTTGMVGGAVRRRLQLDGYTRILSPNRAELELTEKAVIDRYFSKHRPDYVFMIAAKVGGIAANIADPVGFLADNVRSEINLFEACHRYGVKEALFLGSSCIYPRECPQPMKEEYLLNGPFEPTNEGYALAKVVGIRLAQAYRTQFGLETVCPIPPNLYGTGDHFELEKAHVLSALVKRFVDARDNGDKEVTLWGTGNARREFMHVDDLADALLFLLEHHRSPDIINVGTGADVSIRELAELIAKQAQYRGTISWDASKPDGMPRKCMDVTKLNALGYQPKINLAEGIKKTIQEYETIKETQS